MATVFHFQVEDLTEKESAVEPVDCALIIIKTGRRFRNHWLVNFGCYCLLKTKVESVAPRGLSL